MIYKFFRDPIYDTIEVDEDEILSLIATAEFQRLRSIKQLGFSYFVYPGCEHTRFQHSLGVYHLMKMALRSICGLSEEEKLAALISGLTHDIGHGAFSHVTEKAILTRKHERYTCDILETILPEIVDKTCSKIAIDIIKKSYEHKPFLSDLLSSQLDVDRLDYLVRDSYYAGVKYGTVDVQRLLSSICLYKDPDENRTSISFAQKSVYSIEGYILARYFMYWQVYFHKTAVSAELLFKKIVERVQFLLDKEYRLNISESFKDYLSGEPSLENYIKTDDISILYHINTWQESNDGVLADLCKRFCKRQFFKPVLLDKLVFSDTFESAKDIVKSKGFNPDYYYGEYSSLDVPYDIYDKDKPPIMIQQTNGTPKEISSVMPTDVLKILAGKKLTRSYICVPEECREDVKELIDKL